MNAMTKYDLQHNFTYHPPTKEQAERYKLLRAFGLDMGKVIEDYCPESAERTLAFRKLEECIMWANAAIARNE